MLLVRGGAVDFALGAQMSRELVTDEVGESGQAYPASPLSSSGLHSNLRVGNVTKGRNILPSF
jgi:hypothetical protein